MLVTVIPRASMMAPMDAAARPLPSEESTPPVMKMYLVDFLCDMICTYRRDLGDVKGWTPRANAPSLQKNSITILLIL
jgi:hypothetical protein